MTWYLENWNIVGALLNYNTIFHDIDIVCFIKDMQSMSDQYTSPIRQRAIEDTVLKNSFTNVSIDRAQSIVQQDNIWWRISCSGKWHTSLEEKHYYLGRLDHQL